MPENDPEIPQSHDPPLTAGSCILGQPQIGKIVQDALLFFETKRYFLRAWCIMPNHVHVVITPLPEESLEKILHSWKSFTANQINRIRNKPGEVWMRESFTHVVREGGHLQAYIDYTEQNPVAAGFCSTPSEWAWSSAGMSFRPSPLARFIDPRDTPFVELQYRGRLPQLYKAGCTYFVTFRLADAVATKSSK